jgi:hypothetical protein
VRSLAARGNREAGVQGSPAHSHHNVAGSKRMATAHGRVSRKFSVTGAQEASRAVTTKTQVRSYLLFQRDNGLPGPVTLIGDGR